MSFAADVSRRNIMKRIFAAITAMAVGLTMLTACADEGNLEGEIYIPIRQGTTVNYNTAKVYRGTIMEQVTLDAEFTTPYYTDLAFTMMGGTLDQIYVHQDMEVSEGDIIATLKDDEVEELITEKKIILDNAQQTYDMILESGTEDEIEFAKIDLEIAQAEYDDAVYRREFLTIKAPYDGKITSVSGYWSGAQIEKNAWICTIEDSTRVCLSAVDNSNGQLTNIGFGAKVDIKQGAIASTTGKVVDVVTEEFGGFGNFGGRTETRYIIKPDEDIAFMNFGTIEVTFTTLRRDDALIAPSNAVFEFGDDGYAVNVLVDGVKIQTPVTIGIVSGNQTEILEGLDGTETLIL